MENLFDLQIICPDRIFYEGKASMFELNTTEGEVGIYKNHVPMTMIIAPGVATITEADGIKNAAIHAGFIEILQDKITVLAEVAEWPEEIDLERAKEAKERAENLLQSRSSETDIARAQTALSRAIARIYVKK
ncbi:MAG: ATP synthase F1 subunit epsilon [Lachnospiraceae bacterium]|nr:ATP synthase F1 subunit epsilon [Lachnospiraceae bacterium]